MANSVINTAVGGLLQAFSNNISGTNVQAEAVALVDNGGNFLATLPVSLAANININGTVTSSPGTGTFLDNLVQVGGTAVDTNIGNATAGTLRVVLASNQPNVNVAGSLSIAANSAFNLSQIGASTVSSAGQTGTLAVGGSVTNGTATSSATNPVLIAGSDYGATPKVQLAKTDSGGGMYVNILGSPTVTAIQSNASNFLATVSGTVTAVQSNASNFLSTISGTVTAIQSNASNLAVSIPGTVNISVPGALNVHETPDGTSAFAPSISTSTAYEASRVIKNAPGVLFNLTGFNSRTSAQYILLFNATTVPGDGVAPYFPPLNVPAGQTFSLDFGGKFGRYFSTGIVVCNSSTSTSKTIGNPDCWFDALYS